MKKICTIILEFNSPKMTLATIASVQKAILPSGYQNQLVIVDNSPVPDGTLAKKLIRQKGIKLITTLQNTGFAQGNNLGITYGLKRGCDYFLILNNDVVVDKLFLKNLLVALNRGFDLAVPKIYFAKGFEYHQSQYRPQELGKVIWYAGGEFDWDNVYSRHFGLDEVDKGQFRELKQIEFANCCCLLVKKSVFKKIGLFDEKYFLYWEDGDFSVRARAAGFRMVYQPLSQIWHKNSHSSGAGSQLHDYYLIRNRLIFGFKYASLRTKLALLRESAGKLFTGRSGEKKGILDFIFHRFGKGVSL